MSRYVFTRKALEDLAGIWSYTYDYWSEIQADKYYSNILETCHQLAEKQHTARNYKLVRNDLFGFKVARHIIFFRIISENEIEIVRILHEMMDLKRYI